MASEYFLKIDGIEGECTKKGVEKQIELDSFSWGAAQQGTFSGTTGGGAGRVDMQDVHFTAKTNKSSPGLMLACATGKHIKSSELSCRKAGGKQEIFMKVKLSDILVSSYQNGGSNGDGIPVDQFSLNFSKIEVEYKPQKPDGSLDSPVVAGYDVTLQEKV